MAANKMLGLTATLACLSGVSADLMAQKTNYPDRPIRLIVPYAPGGGTDVMARALSQKLAETFPSSIVIDNRGGGGGIIGTEMGVKATPDGYTLVFDTSSYATRTVLHRVHFDPIKDMTPITQAFNSGYILTVPPGDIVPVKNVKELIAYAKRNEGKLNYGTSGVGTFLHLSTELFLMMTGTKMNHIPYKGAAPALTDLMSGQIQLMMGSLPIAVAQIKANRLRGLAVTTLDRWHELPDLPAVSETVPGYEAGNWYGMWGPRGLPNEVVSLWSKEIKRVVSLPEMKPRWSQNGVDPFGSTPEQFRQAVRGDIEKWTRVVKRLNLKAAE